MSGFKSLIVYTDSVIFALPLAHVTVYVAPSAYGSHTKLIEDAVVPDTAKPVNCGIGAVDVVHVAASLVPSGILATKLKV